ncbi:MAG TPA: hypothetical protein VFI90_03535, partial [Rubrobacter sp.]|nr:hypothetical protein [Rubrobacter sp.]
MKKLITVIVLGIVVGAFAPVVGHAEEEEPRGMASKRSAVPVGGLKPGATSTQECTTEIESGATNIKLDCDEIFPNNEPDVEVDPTDPLHMIASSNDYGTCC